MSVQNPGTEPGTIDKTEYRVWNPFRSKLAGAAPVRCLMQQQYIANSGGCKIASRQWPSSCCSSSDPREQWPHMKDYVVARRGTAAGSC